MTDELPPELRDFETKLRQLRPLNVSAPLVRRSRQWKRLAASLWATAATILAIVCLIPQRQPQPLPPQCYPVMQQQLADLLGEMHIADAVPKKKPVYPVVEIAVNDAPPQRTAMPPSSWSRRLFEEELLAMFGKL